MNALSRSDLSRLVANHLPRSGFVNLGIGAPTQVSDYLPSDSEVMLHSENGILNVGPKPPEGQEDWDLVNAGKMPVTLARGGSYFDSALSFAMMRGGHIDVAILGAFEVSEQGDLANWTTGEGGGSVPGIGGAIDLAVGARQIWVMMEHTTRDGAPRIVRSCTLPLTARKVVSRIFTSLAVIDVSPSGLVVDALLEGVSLEEVAVRTGAPLRAAPTVRTFYKNGALAS
jgi:3-oxoadipate CoA-transferase beta subunit